MSLTVEQKQHLKSVLDRQLQDAETQLAQSEKDSAVVELDQSRNGRLTRMDAMQQQAMAEATTERLKLRIQTLQTALVRIDCSDYGFCSECDEPINPKRLEISPDTQYCINCAP